MKKLLTHNFFGLAFFSGMFCFDVYVKLLEQKTEVVSILSLFFCIAAVSFFNIAAFNLKNYLKD